MLLSLVRVGPGTSPESCALECGMAETWGNPPPERDYPDGSPVELRAELAIALADRDRAVAQRDYCQQALHKLRATCQRLQAELATVRGDTSQARTRDETSAAELAEAKAQRDEARRMVEIARRELADLRVQIARVTTDRDELRAQAEEQAAACQRATSNLSSLSAQRDAGRVIGDSLRKQVARLEEEARDADRRAHSAHDEIEFLRFTLDRTVNAGAKQRKDMEKELTEARGQLRDLQHQLSELEQPAAALLEWKTRALEAENKLAYIRDRMDRPL
jgi:chromosome segregation ATPase